jgi:hypothetical protein
MNAESPKTQAHQPTAELITPEFLSKAIKVTYTNWRGERAVRSIVPIEIYWGKTEYHPQEQWLLRVFDVERNAERIYAFKEIEQVVE